MELTILMCPRSDHKWQRKIKSRRATSVEFIFSSLPWPRIGKPKLVNRYLTVVYGHTGTDPVWE